MRCLRVTALRTGPAATAFQLGQNSITLLDRHGQPVPLNLLRQPPMPP